MAKEVRQSKAKVDNESSNDCSNTFKCYKRGKENIKMKKEKYNNQGEITSIDENISLFADTFSNFDKN